MKMKAPILALLVPCAVLAACNRADTTAETESLDNQSTMPAAATGFDGVTPNSTGTTDLDATVTSPTVTGAGADVNRPMDATSPNAASSTAPMDSSASSSSSSSSDSAGNAPTTGVPSRPTEDRSGHPERSAD